MATKTKLKQCPHCGGCAHIDSVVYDIERNTFEEYFVACEKCGAKSETSHNGYALAVRKWNRRTEAKK